MDLSEFDKGHIVMPRRLGQSISKTAALGDPRLIVGHGWPRLIDTHAHTDEPLELKYLKKLMVVLIERCQNTQQIQQHTFRGLEESMPRWVVIPQKRFFLIEERANGQEENLALMQTTTQSSTYNTWYSKYAVDGLRDNCSHTDTQGDPWWRVDLMKVYRVNRVTITNRVSPFYDKINGAVIRVGNSVVVYSNPICAVISTIPSGATANFSCGAMEGRYVIIHIPGYDNILALCEVENFIYFPENRAIGGAVAQSSTSGDWFAQKAIDGNRGLQQLNTGCSSTLNETNPWWRLDLRHIYRVSKVVITNIKHCCAERINGAEIRIGNSLENNGSNNPICAVIPAIPAGQSYSYSCDGMEGRYVTLIIPGNKILTLCEVEVYGEGPALKRSFVKMQFNSRVDLTDPSIRENVLKQLGSALAEKGFTEMTLRWSQTPQQVIQKENTDKRDDHGELAGGGGDTEHTHSGHRKTLKTRKLSQETGVRDQYSGESVRCDSVT
ncbi:uncharacterized protein [Pseudorasbora parva]|uniref:uncharacterized protein n=1 Tax=Pseudorasbora parva TaxID=51549 RepID=UPI00351E7A4E